MTITNPIQITIDAPSLTNNRLGDKLQREVLVYLPPSYQASTTRHYPVIYLMHGFGGNANAWFSDEIPLHEIADSLIEQGKINEMIIVVPENSTRQTCSAYLNSPIQGNWQDFICHDLINAIEAKFRCQQGWENRAIIGHSSGGDAVLKTLFLSPNVFKHGFAMSAPNIKPTSLMELKEFYDAHFESLQQASLGKLAIENLDIWAHILLNNLQITLPESNNPPLFCKFPLSGLDWQVLIKGTHLGNYQRYGNNLSEVNLAFDVGLKEYFIQDSHDLFELLQTDGHKVKLIEFDGGHVDHIAKSMLYVLAFISECFSAEY
ncbi:hypothetical protein CW745_05305 [Psychromonas sp. psych-6C06]|uniref:alpha/beta hydrolase n=1 Tax=Psychromonas sp. psych-6C06 TaxID=2058089 RepID=UPI000C3479FA|nr:alpha/beta hydrolase-fold protein [Psychromonas sp. psych-6C06]PKF62839.1 hypothetical protein CW745_05305 [Psychromonas sp. psych-6C06]